MEEIKEVKSICSRVGLPYHLTHRAGMVWVIGPTFHKLLSYCKRVKYSLSERVIIVSLEKSEMLLFSSETSSILTRTE